MNVGWRFLKSLIYPLMVMVVPDVFLDVTLILCMEPWIQVLGNYPNLPYVSHKKPCPLGSHWAPLFGMLLILMKTISKEKT